MADAWGFTGATMALAAVASAIVLRLAGFSWRQTIGVVTQSVVILVTLVAMVILIVALAPSAPLVHS